MRHDARPSTPRVPVNLRHERKFPSALRVPPRQPGVGRPRSAERHESGALAHAPPPTCVGCAASRAAGSSEREVPVVEAGAAVVQATGIPALEFE